MKKFEYDIMDERLARIENVFEFQGEQFYNFLSALNALGQEGWEWVGTHEGEIIFKREILEDEE